LTPIATLSLCSLTLLMVNTAMCGKTVQMTLMQRKGNRLWANASLAMGDGEKVDAALHAAAARFGADQRSDGRDAAIFDVAEELPLSNIPRMALDAVVVLNPEGPDEWGMYYMYKIGYKRERKTGVAKLSPTERVYIIPPPPRDSDPDREEIYKMLEFAGMPFTPGRAMLGLFMTTVAGPEAGA